MPNIKSAAKRMKTSAKAHSRNETWKRRIRDTRKELMAAVSAGDKEKSSSAFSKYCSVLDRAVKRGVVKANAANRRKSRASAKMPA